MWELGARQRRGLCTPQKAQSGDRHPPAPGREGIDDGAVEKSCDSPRGRGGNCQGREARSSQLEEGRGCRGAPGEPTEGRGRMVGGDKDVRLREGVTQS